ncbi:hypothetical protein [Streptomyces reticuli]|nr:hypothetical protein [Streptomyces sp. SID7810]CUW31717.1 hypothetical protein TUE45_06466 [Streptomyces reticuli]
MTAVVDLAALPPTVVVPGIARWLGWTPPEPADAEETYEDFLERISREAQ